MGNENQSSEVKTKNITFGLVVSWIVGVLLVIVGIVSLFTDTITGIFIIIAAFITFPFGNDVIKNKFKVSLSKGLRIFLVILLVVVGVSFSSGNNNLKTTDVSNNIEDNIQKPIEYIKVTALKLSEDYKANEVAADATYKGKQVEASGYINNIGKDITDTAYVSLKTDQYSIVGVQCMFEKDFEPQLVTLSKDQNITLQGEVSGKFMNVLIRGCSIK